MDVRELFARGKPVYSFEFFLPKAPDDLEGFLANVRELKKLRPDFVTLTYGAGGSARDKTIDAAGRLKREVGVETACHLTCITHTKAEISAVLERIEGHGIGHVVALRGDVPKDGSAPPVERRELPYARDLVELVKKRGGFQIAVAGYPETHPEALSPEKDLENLALKVAAGADWVVTQLFFDNRDYFSFVEKTRALGIKVPIVPGIMPVSGYGQLKRFTQLCGAKIPPEMSERLERIQNDPEAVVAFGVEWAARQCRELIERGAPGVHFYTLNKTRSTAEILANLRKAL